MSTPRTHLRRKRQAAALSCTVLLHVCGHIGGSGMIFYRLPIVESRRQGSHRHSTQLFSSRIRLVSNIISLRGGADDNTNNENNEDFENDLSPINYESLDDEGSKTLSTVILAVTERWKQFRNVRIIEKALNNSYQDKFHSFLARFRAAPAAGAEFVVYSGRTTGTLAIAHKLPHGPDGRGGGGSAMVESVLVAELETERKEQIVIPPSTNDIHGDNVVHQSDKSVCTKSSTAFVIPPTHPSSVDSQIEDDVKESKSSKSKLTIEDVYNIEAGTNLRNNTRNETTDMMTLSNSSLIVNTKESVISATNTSVGENSDGMKVIKPQDYTSSGYWIGIDLIASIGLSSIYDGYKLSRALRPIRKAVANATGLHGFISRKQYVLLDPECIIIGTTPTVISIDEELGIHDVKSIEAEILARKFASRKMRRHAQQERKRKNNPRRRWGFRRRQQILSPASENPPPSEIVVVPVIDASPDALDQSRLKRVEEIDRLLHRGNERLLELQCERDDLLCAPNPLFNYTKKAYDPSINTTFGVVRTTRQFNFPPSELVDEYIGELVSCGRLVHLNHTELWQSRSDDGEDDDEVGDDLLTPGADARRLYENLDWSDSWNRNKGVGGSWLLRQGLGGNSFGEKLGETIEIAVYKGVCSAVMSVLARMLSGLHGVNVLSHSDIKTYVEQDPDLPPMDKNYGIGRDMNYAHDAIKNAIQKGAKKKRKTSRSNSSHKISNRRHGHELSDDAFIQRDAVVETLISHCQISAPLLKLFPLDWQRAMVGNVITLATAIVSDFADGLQIQLLGHALSVSFKPITEADLIQHIGVGGFRQNHRRTRPAQFEAAVLATALDISENLSFLDGWLEWIERKVGGGVLRSQISNLIARVVLTLVDEVLSGARLDLWSSQANGPRLYAALEHRTSTKFEEDTEWMS